MIRLFDILFSFIGLVLLSPLLLIVALVLIFDTGSPFFRQERVGAGKKPFKLLKFRSMHLDTQSTATHLVQVSAITKSGFFFAEI
jgi:lipopolysaccharide/colanic/teichoic acid biosynthesis glycosyltransferase